MNKSTKMLTRAGVIAALYVVLTFIVLPVASGAIQFRPGEALSVLPLLFAESVPALFVGCLIANLVAGAAVQDIVFGALVSLLAAALTWASGKVLKNKWAKALVGGIFPVALNAFLLPLIWIWAYGALEYAYLAQVGFLLLSQSVAVYLLGIPLYLSMRKAKEKYPALLGDVSPQETRVK
ncbi:MAG: hypothetical protein DBX59_02255 [Bacillota bacterium]|nr:MAG: hypothetical protein DBX59_02255 [Bacillota bacterium]